MYNEQVLVRQEAAQMKGHELKCRVWQRRCAAHVQQYQDLCGQAHLVHPEHIWKISLTNDAMESSLLQWVLATKAFQIGMLRLL